MKENVNIIGLDILPTFTLPGTRVKSYQGSLTDYNLILKILKENNVSIVIHLAAVPDDANANILLPPNINGVSNVLKAIEDINNDVTINTKITRLVIASSGKLYCGYNSVDKPLKIDAPYAPRCMYGATKAFAEAAAEVFALDTKIPTIMLRFAWCPRMYCIINFYNIPTNIIKNTLTNASLFLIQFAPPHQVRLPMSML
jgi:nucleoside-diphosphate-sugar epimerase